MEDQTITFRKQALELSKWDKMLLDNSGKIMALHGSVKKVEVAQKTLDSNLEIISRQQDELHQLLEQLENEVDKVYAARTSNGQLGGADSERESGYALAEEINSDLDQMANTLKDHINKLNAAHTSAADSDNPVYQIVEILNAHLHSLQWVEDNSNQLHSKLKTLRTQFKAHQDQQDHLRRIRNDYYYH